MIITRAFRNTLGLGLFGATIALVPANAADWGDQVDLCAAAITEQGIADADAHRVKFVSGKGSRTKTLILKLTPRGEGEAFKVECVVKRKVVESVTVKA